MKSSRKSSRPRTTGKSKRESKVSAKKPDRSKDLSKSKKKPEVKAKPIGTRVSLHSKVTFSDGVIAAGLLLLLISLPLVFSMWFTTYNDPKNALARFIIFFMLAVWLIKMGRSGKVEILKTPLDLPLIAFFLISAISLVRATNIYEGLDALFRQLLYLILYFVIVNNIKDKRWFDRSLVVLSIAGGIVAFYGILQMLGIDFLPLSAQNGPISSLGNRDFASEFLILSIPVSIALFVLSKGVYTRWVYGLFAAMMFAHFTTANARGTWMGCILALMIFALFFSLRVEGRLWTVITLSLVHLLSGLTAVMFYVFTRGSGLPMFIYIGVYVVLSVFVSALFLSLRIEEPSWKTMVLFRSYLSFLAYLLSVLVAFLLILSLIRNPDFDKKLVENLTLLPIIACFILLIVTGLILYFQRNKTVAVQELNKRLILIVAICLMTSSLVFTYMSTIAPRLAARGELIGSSHLASDITAKGHTGEVRKYVYLTAINTILQNPILGVGIGNWAVIYPAYKVPELENDVRWEQTHNEYLQILSETGVVGFAAFLSILGAMAFMSWRILRKVKDEYWYILAAISAGGIIAILANNMFNFSFQNPASGVIFWIFVGFLGRIYYMAEKTDALSTKSLEKSESAMESGILAGLSQIAKKIDDAFTLSPSTEEGSTTKWRISVRVSEFGRGVISVFSVLMMVVVVIVVTRPLVGDYHLKKGIVYSMGNDWKKATRELERSVTWYDYSFEPHFRLGQAYVSLAGQRIKDEDGRTFYDKAIEQYSRTLDLRPNYERAHNNLGDVLVRQGKFEDAIGSFQASVNLFPNYAVARSNLGVVYERLGRYNEAVAEYDEALKIDPNNASMHKNIGVVYFYHLKDYPKAAYHWDKALSLNPNDGQAKAIQTNLQLIKRAIEYQRLLQASPNSTLLYNGLGVTYESLNRAEDAASEYKKALDINPYDPVANRNLGNLFLRSGDKDKAAQHWGRAVVSWEEVLQSNPEDANTARIKEEVVRLKGEIEKLLSKE